jgi:hypothetical protein
MCNSFEPGDLVIYTSSHPSQRRAVGTVVSLDDDTIHNSIDPKCVYIRCDDNKIVWRHRDNIINLTR